MGEAEDTEVWLLLMNTLVRLTGLLVFAGIAWNYAGTIRNFLLSCDLTRLALLYNKGSSHAQLLAWLQENLPMHDLTLHVERTLWTNGSFLCILVNIAVPDACLNPYCHQDETPAHGQVLAYKYLGVTPVFSEDELSHISITAQQKQKLLNYLIKIKTSIDHFKDSTENMIYNTDYIAKGMGLVTGEENRKSVFFIYPIPKKHQPEDITVSIKGPYSTYGEITIPALYQKTIQNATEYKRSLYLSAKLNSVSPTLQGTRFLRKLNLSFGGGTEFDIQIRIKVTKTYAKVIYIPKKAGIHEVHLTTNGHNLIGSPFIVPIDSPSNRYYEDDSLSEDEPETILISKKYISGIVDVEGEKMILKENGTLEKISKGNHHIKEDIKYLSQVNKETMDKEKERNKINQIENPTKDECKRQISDKLNRKLFSEAEIILTGNESKINDAVKLNNNEVDKNYNDLDSLNQNFEEKSGEFEKCNKTIKENGTKCEVDDFYIKDCEYSENNHKKPPNEIISKTDNHNLKPQSTNYKLEMTDENLKIEVETYEDKPTKFSTQKTKSTSLENSFNYDTTDFKLQKTENKSKFLRTLPLKSELEHGILDNENTNIQNLEFFSVKPKKKSSENIENNVKSNQNTKKTECQSKILQNSSKIPEMVDEMENNLQKEIICEARKIQRAISRDVDEDLRKEQPEWNNYEFNDLDTNENVHKISDKIYKTIDISKTNDVENKCAEDLDNDNAAKNLSTPDILDNNITPNNYIQINYCEIQNDYSKIKKTFSSKDPFYSEEFSDTKNEITNNLLINKMVNLFEEKINTNQEILNESYKKDKQTNKKNFDSPDILKCHSTKIKTKNKTHSESTYPQNVKEYKTLSKKLKRIGISCKSYDKKQRFLKSILRQDINKRNEKKLSPVFENEELDTDDNFSSIEYISNISNDVPNRIQDFKIKLFESNDSSSINKTEEVKPIKKEQLEFISSIKIEKTKILEVDGIVDSNIKIFTNSQENISVSKKEPVELKLLPIEGLVKNKRQLFENDTSFKFNPDYHLRKNLPTKSKQTETISMKQTETNNEFVDKNITKSEECNLTENLPTNSKIDVIEKKNQVLSTNFNELEDIKIPTVGERISLLLKSASKEFIKPDNSEQEIQDKKQKITSEDQKLVEVVPLSKSITSVTSVIVENKTDKESRKEKRKCEKLTKKRLSRFEKAKHFFKSLEDTREDLSYNYPTIIEQKLEKSISDSCLISDKNNHNKTITGSSKSIDVLERFSINNLYTDEELNEFNGISNNNAVVASLTSLDEDSSKIQCKETHKNEDLREHMQKNYPHLQDSDSGLKPKAVVANNNPGRFWLAKSEEDVFV